MKPFTRSRPLAISLRIFAVGWILSGVAAFMPRQWLDAFLVWGGMEPVGPALMTNYLLAAVGWVCIGVGVVMWIAAADVVRYRPVVIAIITLHEMRKLPPKGAPAGGRIPLRLQSLSQPPAAAELSC